MKSRSRRAGTLDVPRATSVESDGERYARRRDEYERRAVEVMSTSPLPGKCATCGARLELHYRPFRWLDAATGLPHACRRRRRR